MDSPPPNNPNNNNNNNNRRIVKPDPLSDGRESGEMDIIGNLQDQPAVVVMFLIGVAAW
eukprot:CAMPEP_0194145596 /NCGR_PEP_ID=MMETSP0152-20130528/17693_1 /TAXON_ID=1049557 /ORGANISM="Thalassiothrix antarctica, Strain L6-D1" /LENGTH=58 /DNA_ID=CAMNT_0038845873 /DNA_START=131 /DNA_END=304 /DNA_ORIENTATION=-